VSERFFGFSANMFCSEVFQAVDDYIADGIDAMEVTLCPSFTTEHDRKLLKVANDAFIEQVCKNFDRNMDKFEIYAHRNIFSVPKEVEELVGEEMVGVALTPGKKKRRVSEGGASLKGETTPAGAAAPSPSSMHIPSDATAVPSKQQLLDLDAELSELRNKLRNARRHAKCLAKSHQAVLRALDDTAKSAEGVAAAINAGSESIGAPLHDTVSAVVMGKDGLAQLKEEGEALVAMINQEAGDENSHNSHSGQEYAQNSAAAKSPAQQFNKGAISGTSARDISNLTNILKK
jgi:hypothetical protein